MPRHLGGFHATIDGEDWVYLCTHSTYQLFFRKFDPFSDIEMDESRVFVSPPEDGTQYELVAVNRFTHHHLPDAARPWEGDIKQIKKSVMALFADLDAKQIRNTYRYPQHLRHAVFPSSSRWWIRTSDGLPAGIINIFVREVLVNIMIFIRGPS